MIEYAESSTEMTSPLLNTPWKVEPPGGNIVDPEKKKTSSIQLSLGAKKDDYMKNRWTEDNVVQRKIVNERTHSDHTRGNIIQKHSMI
jgi:hypothetical protein